MAEHAAQQAAWDTLWNVPEHRAFSRGPSFRHKVRLVQSRVRKHGLRGRVLDVACGTGELLSQLGPAMTELTGADVSIRALERARRVCPRARFVQLDIEASALPETFDVIFCTNALEEMERDGEALRHMTPMLSPGGVLVLVTPHRKDYWTAKDALAGNKRRYEREELRRKLADAGLRVVELTTWGWPFYRLWYRSMARVNQDAVWEQRSLTTLARWAGELAYRLLFLDDLFANAALGSILVAVARK